MAGNRFENLLKSEDIILLDGAMGTMLIRSGISPGDCPEAWNVDQPENIRAVHRGYIQAGSRIILTNTFGGTGIRLRRHNLEGRVGELNREAARIARLEADAATNPVAVGGSIGPTGSILKPIGPLDYNEARDAFAEQAQALHEGGVDVLWIETMSDLNEVKAAHESVRSVSDLPVVATMSFDTAGRTMMGIKPGQMVKVLTDLGLFVMGANCGKGPDELIISIQAMKAENPDITLVAKANAGLPKIEAGQVVYDGSPEVMAEYALQAQKTGARLIGGCCGSTPEHIQAMAQALGLPIPGEK